MKVLQRKQLFRKIKKVSENPVILLCAPMGYGKTTSLNGYFQHLGAENIWFSTEGECDEEWIWKKIQEAVGQIEGNEHEGQTIEIPRNQQEAEMWIEQNFASRTEPIHLVLDDFVWGNYTKLEAWIALCCGKACEKLKIWVLSRTMPEGNLMEQICRKRIGLLQVEDLAFGKDEIKRLCDQEHLEHKDDLPSVIFSYTNGWIAAIELVVAHYQSNQQLYNPLELNWLMKVAFYDNVEEPMKLVLMKLSILKEFTWKQAEYLCEKSEIRLFLAELIRDNNFIYELSGEKCRIVSVCREMLHRELLQSNLNMTALYNRSGEWFLQEGKPIEAIQAYAYCGNYEKIMSTIKRYDDRSLTDMAPELMQRIFQNMPEAYRREYPYIYMKWIQDVITNIGVWEGKALLEAYRKEIQLGMVKGSYESLMGEYYFARAFTQFNDARKMHEDFQKADEFLQAAGEETARLAYPCMVDTFGANHMLYLYHNEPGDLEALVADIQEKACHFIRISGGVNSGMEYQTKAEYEFETGNGSQVEELSVKAFVKAKEARRTSIMICSRFLRGRYGIWRRDNELTEEIIGQLRRMEMGAENPIIRCEAECARAYLHALRGEKNEIPGWISNGEIEKSALLPEGAGVFYIAYGLVLLLQKNYKKLLKISIMLEEQSESGRHVFGAVYSKIFKSICYFKADKQEEAAVCARELLLLCEKDHIIMPLIECREYLKEILNGSVYQGEILKELMQIYEQRPKEETKKKQSDRICLTKKEKEVLAYTLKGLRVQEIADEMGISINTARTHMKALYRKWNVNSKIALLLAYEQEKKQWNSSK